ncbi:hypothetical protein ACWD0J_33020 [Streptomyces sp. NPDC003011]
MTGTTDGDRVGESRGIEMTVGLDRPLGERVLLDAYTGRPVE